ncbi:MAG TPA: cytochrome c oxidase subunit II [Burkholderiales bacterium]|jgi:cytochrome c oxidase subunit 2|nr:cytochrome c oxidase subunit II [Burkholderiales bacterium]
MTSKWFKGLALAAAWMMPGLALAGVPQDGVSFNFQTPVTPVAHDIYNLHQLIFWICVIIFIGVFGTITYSVIRHRKSIGHQAAHFHENTTIEIIWTIIPLLILAGVAYPASRVVVYMKDTSAPDMTIKVTGYQWKWHYDYLNQGVGFYSNLATPMEEINNQKPKDANYLLAVDRPLVVPTGEKIRLLITAGDVIHSWWVPAFGVKQDAIPGFIRDTWFKVDKPGTYRGQCAELCGKNHGFMPIVVKAVSPADYKTWLAGQKKSGTEKTASENPNKTWTKDELVKAGAKVYSANCAACHQANGMGIPNTFPALKDGPIVKGPKEEHIKTVLHGVKGTAMPAWGPRLNDTEIAEVITYERNSWGNNFGMVTPAEVKALRQ